jgi:hypothetical protein
VVKPLAAELTVIAVLADGRRVELHATLRPPFEADDGQWVARVQLEPLQKEPLEVRGVDSFHALWLACSLVLKLLSQLAAEGTRLEAVDGSEFPLEAYLAGLTPKT